jgi:hypothetical protein
VVEVRPQTSYPVSVPNQAVPSQTSFSLLDENARSILDLVALDNDSYTEWMNGLKDLFGGDDTRVGGTVDRHVQVGCDSPSHL